MRRYSYADVSEVQAFLSNLYLSNILFEFIYQIQEIIMGKWRQNTQ